MRCFAVLGWTKTAAPLDRPISVLSLWSIQVKPPSSHKAPTTTDYLPSKQPVGETSLERVVSGIIGRRFDLRKLISTMTIPAHCVVVYPRALSEFESVLKHPEELARPSSSGANSLMFHFNMVLKTATTNSTEDLTLKPFAPHFTIRIWT